MSAIFRTDSGIFGDIQASNMIVTGEIKIGTEDQTINQYITQQINTTVGDGIDYTVEISSLSAVDSGIFEDISSLAATNGGSSNNTNDISSLSAVDTLISGDLSSLAAIDSAVDSDISSLSAVDTLISGDLSSLAAIDSAVDSDISSLSAVDAAMSGDISSLAALESQSSNYSDSDLETYLSGRLETHIIPSGNALYDIGEPENKIRHLYLSNNSLYMGGEGTDPGTQISATPEGAIVFPSGINISGAIGGVTPNAENNSIQWNTENKQWESSNTLHTATGDLYSFYKRDHDAISNVTGNFNALSFGSHSIPASSNSPGTIGQIAYSQDHVYMCVATNTWRRWTLSDF